MVLDPRSYGRDLEAVERRELSTPAADDGTLAAGVRYANVSAEEAAPFIEACKSLRAL